MVALELTGYLRNSGYVGRPSYSINWNHFLRYRHILHSNPGLAVATVACQPVIHHTTVAIGTTGNIVE